MIRHCKECGKGYSCKSRRLYCSLHCKYKWVYRNLKLHHPDKIKLYRKKRFRSLKIEWDSYRVIKGCSICGYRGSGVALDFHHVDPTKKDPNYRVNVDNWKKYKSELETGKCILVCANCHREIHSITKSSEVYDDTYFMGIARTVSELSPCLSRKVGSVIARGNRILGIGYNALPSELGWSCWEKFGSPEGTCPRKFRGYKSGEGLDLCLAVHAEENSIIDTIGRCKDGVRGATLYLYCDKIPCTRCAGAIIRAGITEVICLSLNEYQDEVSALEMFEQAGVRIRTVGGNCEQSRT